MTDEANEGGQSTAVESGASGVTGPSGMPEWMGSLPDDLRGDQTLGRYKTLEAACRGLVETRTHVISRGFPAYDDDWSPEKFSDFYHGIGWPKDPAEYEIEVPEGDDGSLADAFRPVAHKLGLTKAQAKAMADFHTAQITGAMDGFYAQGEQEIGALRAELGTQYEAKRDIAKATYLKLGFPPEFADELDTKVGSSTLVRGFMELGELIGEDGKGLAALLAAPEAEAQLRELQRDSSWRQRFEAGEPQAVAERQRLLSAAQAHAGATARKH